MGHRSGFSGSSACSSYMSSVTASHTGQGSEVMYHKVVMDHKGDEPYVANTRLGHQQRMLSLGSHLSVRHGEAPLPSDSGYWCSCPWGWMGSSWCVSAPWRRLPSCAALLSSNGNTCTVERILQNRTHHRAFTHTNT